MYPPAGILLVTWTAAQFPDSRVATETPANLQTVLASKDAVIRIERYGGPRGVTIDQPLVDVDVFATTDLAADLLCGSVCEAWEWQLPGVTIDAGAYGKAVVAGVRITSAPSKRPVTDPGLARFGASVQVWLHSA